MSNAATELSTDIYSLVYDALWFVLESHPDFVARFPAGNRIKFSGANPDPEKNGKQVADAPAAMLVPNGPTNTQSQTSSSCTREMAFTRQVESAAKSGNPVGGINQLVDIVDRAFRAWGDAMPDIEQVKQSRGGPAPKEPGDSGWAAAVQITVTVYMEKFEMEFAQWA